MTGRPTCPACGGAPGRASEFCGACWAEVPQKLRTELSQAWNAVRGNPTSIKSRRWYDDVVADCVEAATRHTKAAR